MWKPGDSSTTPTQQFTYTPASNGVPFQVEVTQRTWAGSGYANTNMYSYLFYDGFGRQAQTRTTYMNDPEMGVWTYAYDAVGNLTRQRYAYRRGVLQALCADALGVYRQPLCGDAHPAPLQRSTAR
jgi:YD repeat-containing protein